MALVTKEFDVKIRVILPRLTKGISAQDKERIEARTLFKYEPQSPVQQPVAAQSSKDDGQEISLTELREQALQEMRDLSKDFKKMRDAAGKRLASIEFRYDPEAIENESYRDAEEGLFGIATGVIGYDKYLKAQEYSQKIDEEIRRRLVANGGTLDAVA